MKSHLFLFTLVFFTEVISSTELFPIHESRLTDKILVLQRGPWNDMMTFVDAGPSLVVIDTWSSPSAATEGRKIAEEIFKKKVSHVINTHFHWDHVFGNQAFTDATIIGQFEVPDSMNEEYGNSSSLNKSMEDLKKIDESDDGQAYVISVAKDAMKNLHLTVPKVLISNDETIRVGDMTISLLPAPGIHTHTYMLVHFQEIGLLIAPKEIGFNRPPKLETGGSCDIIISKIQKIAAIKAPLKVVLLGHFDPILNPSIEIVISKWKEMSKKQ